MALNESKLKATPGLETLTAEQIAAITLLSKNDEDIVVGGVTKNFHDKLEETIKTASGIEKIGDEKSYVYAERVLKAQKAATDGMVAKTEFDKLKGEYEELQRTAGDPEGWKTKYETASNRVTKLEKDLRTEKEKSATTLAKARVDFAIDSAVSGLTFEASVPENLRNLAKDSAVAKLKSMPAAFNAETGAIEFRDETGEVLFNPKNYQKPFTVSELLAQELEPYGVLAKGKPTTTGGGTVPQTAGAAVNVTTGTATTKQDAMAAIHKGLEQQGLRRGTVEWATAENKAFIDNKVNELPEANE